MTTQVCDKCNQTLLLSSFDKSGDSYRHTCKNCRYERTKELRQEKKVLNQNKLRFKKEKKCVTCSKTKPIIEFNRLSTCKDGISSNCRICNSKNRKMANKKVAPLLNVENKICNTCGINKSIAEFKPTARSQDGHYHKCNACWKPREWNKEKQKRSEKKYCDKNKSKLQAKWKNDGQKLNRKIKSRLSNRIKYAFKASSLKKDSKTMDYLGCSHAHLKKWFEFLFVDGMTWDTMGDWHIDHVVPCASFDLTKEDDIKQCFSWKNIRPCWAVENLEKGSLTIPEVVESHMRKVNDFLNNPLPNPPGDREGGAN